MAGKDKFTKDQLLTAMWNTGAIVMDMAKQLNTSTKVVYDYLRRYPELEEEKKLIESATLDLAESKLLQAIRRGDMRAVSFYLRYKGGDRGYKLGVKVEDDIPVKPQKLLAGEVDYRKLPTEVLHALIEHTIENEEEDEEAA